MTDNFYVYVHSRHKNGEPFYVGKGRGARCREACNRNQHWKNIVAKDGGFYTSLIARDIDEELALLVEVEAIDKYRRLGAQLTNVTDGGEGSSGFRPSKETREKMSAVRKGRTAWNKDKKHTAETILKMSASQKGHAAWNKGVPRSEDLKLRQSILMLGNTFHRGKKASEETKRKQSIAHVGFRHSEESLEKMRAAGLARGISQELRAKMNAANRRGPASEETKRKMSETRKGRPAVNKGTPHSLEAKEKMRAAQLARWARVRQSTGSS